MTPTHWHLIGCSVVAPSAILLSISILPQTSRSTLFPQGIIRQGFQKCLYVKFVTFLKTAKSLIGGSEISYFGGSLLSTSVVRT